MAAMMPDVGLDRLRAAEPLELALLQHAQELDLRRGRHLADFVEQQHAAGGGLDLPGLALMAPVNAPRSWPNSSDSSSVSGSAAQLTATNGHAAAPTRGGCSARSLPCRCPTRRSAAPWCRFRRPASPRARRLPLRGLTRHSAVAACAVELSDSAWTRARAVRVRGARPPPARRAASASCSCETPRATCRAM